MYAPVHRARPPHPRLLSRFADSAVVPVSNMYLYEVAVQRAEHLAAALDSRAGDRPGQGILMERFSSPRPGVPGAHPGVDGDQHEGPRRRRALRPQPRPAVPTLGPGRGRTEVPLVQRGHGPPAAAGRPRPRPAVGPGRDARLREPGGRSRTVADVDPFRGLGMPRIPGLNELLTLLQTQTEALAQLPRTLSDLNGTVRELTEATTMAHATISSAQRIAERLEELVEELEEPVRALSPAWTGRTGARRPRRRHGAGHAAPHPGGPGAADPRAPDRPVPRRLGDRPAAASPPGGRRRDLPGI